PSLLTLFLCGGQAALAQETPRAAAATPARLATSDFSHLLKPAAESEGEKAAAPPEADAGPAITARPAARFEFGRGDDAATDPFPQTTQDSGAQSPQGGQQAAQPYVPLTSGQKMRRAFKSAFLSPQGYALSAFRAVLTQAGEDELPDKEFEDEFGDWAARFARNVANRSTRTIFASGVYPVLFKQDPRYERAPKKSFLRRTGHAVSRVFVTRGDDGDLEPNYSRFAGVVTASGLSNIWERSTPGHDRVGADATVRRIARSFPNDMLFNVVREFLPDIIGIFRK
ncbi:MAG: hypothetical protein M3416_21805, partial [Acidobacteriota bacterium]|nr:hypothetical protein [Acidobacteriota bacterium]